MNDAVLARARALLRTHWRSAVLLGVVAGLGAAIPTAAWGVARRTDAALPNFLAGAGIPDLIALPCPPDFSLPDTSSMSEEQAQAVLAPCWEYDPTADLPDLLALPEVADAAISSFVVGSIGGVFDTPVLTGANVDHDPDAPRANGTGRVLQGRELDPHSPNEFMIGELTAKDLPEGVGVGSRFTFTPLLASQGDCASGIDCVPGGPAVELELVGVARTPTDLASTSSSDGVLHLSPAFWQTYGADDFFSYGSGASLWAADGYDAEDIVRAVEHRWPGRLVKFDSAIPPSVLLLPDVIGLQSRASRSFAAVTAVAAFIFVGQALSRQARRESHDVAVYSALGMPRRELVVAAGLRALPSAGIAAAVAVGVAFALSGIGPIGIARRTIASPTLDFDALVLGVGAVVVFAFVVAACIVPVLRLPVGFAGVGRSRGAGRSPRERRVARWLGAPAATGLRSATAIQRQGAVPLLTAVVGGALAVATLVAAATVTASLDDLLSSPVRYGVNWDVNVGNNGSRDDEARSFDALRSVDGIAAAAGIISADASSGDVALSLVAMAPIEGLTYIEPVVVRGRPPGGPEEIALGRTSLRQLGLELGDHMTFSYAELPDRSFTALIVGEALIYDGLYGEAGSGGVVDADWARSAGSSPSAQTIAVRLEAPGDRESALAALRGHFAQFVSTPQPSYGIRNLSRVRNAPWLLAAVVALLAVGAFAHALVLSVRGRRRELAILKVLGFRRRQVFYSVAWQASFVAAVALLVGLPLGIAGGRWGWWALARSVGVTTAATQEPLVWLVCIGGLLALVNLVALVPGRTAADVRAATVLHSE